MVDSGTDPVRLEATHTDNSIELKTPNGWEFRARGLVGVFGSVFVILVGLFIWMVY